jgi:hypothetical protein
MGERLARVWFRLQVLRAKKFTGFVLFPGVAALAIGGFAAASALTSTSRTAQTYVAVQSTVQKTVHVRRNGHIVVKRIPVVRTVYATPVTVTRTVTRADGTTVVAPPVVRYRTVYRRHTVFVRGKPVVVTHPVTNTRLLTQTQMLTLLQTDTVTSTQTVSRGVTSTVTRKGATVTVSTTAPAQTVTLPAVTVTRRVTTTATVTRPASTVTVTEPAVTTTTKTKP